MTRRESKSLDLKTSMQIHFNIKHRYPPCGSVTSKQHLWQYVLNLEGVHRNVALGLQLHGNKNAGHSTMQNALQGEIKDEMQTQPADLNWSHHTGQQDHRQLPSPLTPVVQHISTMAVRTFRQRVTFDSFRCHHACSLHWWPSHLQWILIKGTSKPLLSVYQCRIIYSASWLPHFRRFP